MSDSGYKFEKMQRESYRKMFSDMQSEMNSSVSQPEVVIEWDRGIHFRKWFQLDEAACIIEGIHPDNLRDWGSQRKPPNITSMLQALLDTQSELEINNEGSNGVPWYVRASHQSIANWCNRRELKWPLKPAPQAQPRAGATDASNLAQRLAEAELKADRLAQELSITTTERDRLRHELQGLTDDLVSAKKEAAQSMSALQKANADLLEGKGRTSMLKLVGGMALICGATIHDQRLEGLKFITDRLDKAGASVGDDTVRKILKEAAQLIPQPKARQP